MRQVRNGDVNHANRELRIPKLEKSRVYQLLNIWEDPHNPGQSVVNSMTAPMLAYSYALSDGTLVELQYVDRTIDKPSADGKYTKVDMTDTRWFQFGVLMVKQSEPGLAFILDNSPENASNPNRPQFKPAKFRLLDQEQDAKDDLEREVKIIRALAMVADMSDDEARELAPQFNLSPNQDIAVLKKRLLGAVRTNPGAVMSLKANFKPRVDSIIRAAEQCKAVVYYAKERQWLWAGDGPASERILFALEGSNLEPKKALTKYTNENAEIIIPKMIDAIKTILPDYKE